ncbi:hypothetical protein B4U79_12721 [Dinothrombium tinctorium]|uniref:CXXC-type domain-containing protein n=1 Tax=Dinothrombium tinctorium TaxID=1965070 RepID=A0A443RC08_9ACAR|nr:hypothetical protein B4U79_12721 [Dinothrombium tinctorium]
MIIEVMRKRRARRRRLPSLRAAGLLCFGPRLCATQLRGTKRRSVQWAKPDSTGDGRKHSLATAERLQKANEDSEDFDPLQFMQTVDSRNGKPHIDPGMLIAKESCKSLVCDCNGIIIAEMVYRCMLCSAISESVSEAQKHYQIKHLDCEFSPAMGNHEPNVLHSRDDSDLGEEFPEEDEVASESLLSDAPLDLKTTPKQHVNKFVDRPFVKRSPLVPQMSPVNFMAASALAKAKIKNQKNNFLKPISTPEDPSSDGSPANNAAVLAMLRSTVKKNWGCRKCSGCLVEDCGKCNYCLDKPKFGGPNTLKKKCVQRKCIMQEQQKEQGNGRFMKKINIP